MNKSLAKGIYYLAQRVRKEGTADKLGELNKMQWLSSSQIKQQQQERLDAIIQYAAENVPFYRKRFERVSTLEDFGKIPVLTREEVRSNIGSLLSEKCSRKAFLSTIPAVQPVSRLPCIFLRLQWVISTPHSTGDSHGTA